ncbi:uncharacterized protein [Spinacia oleracea]|uniref:Reverse transcriptase domain-containing protein n=1 Tax=Spinacia oleracea TaxID=3562 RepID=A0ABM3R2A9_SPIOL|nr:uncharacterized protein LOC130464262 [Spinacia oleracea]
MNYECSPRGRVWIGWKHVVVSVQLLYKTEFCIHCVITTKNGLFSAMFTAVYGLHSVDARRPMWREITNFSGTVSCPWLVMGDFNAVLLANDRDNGNAVTEGETKDFDSCMDSAGISDHSPLVMSCNIQMGGGSRPFKFFNYMADHAQFLDVVRKGWGVTCPGRGVMLKVWTKLKAVKQGLKELHHKDFAKLDQRIEELRVDLSQIQTQLASCPTDIVVQQSEREFSETLKKFLHIQERAYRQKARIQWLQVGDSNSKKKISVMKERLSENSIDILYDDTGKKLSTTQEIQEEVSSFYKKLIGTAASSLTGVDVGVVRKGKQLSVADAEMLVEPISDAEIDAAIKGIDTSKALGLDGFNSLFFLKVWGIVKADVYEAVKEFFRTGVMLKQVNNTSVTLVPKIQNASCVKDFRPIACCSVVYKIISKILTARMQSVIGKVVSCAQSGFIPSKAISDNILLACELVKCYSRKYVSPRCMIKVDLKKAYDSLEWPFLKTMLSELGFPAKFVNWVMQCLYSVSYSILINGCPTKPIPAKKGLRQGDPISPYFTVNSIGVPQGTFPFKYLGVPLTTRKLSFADYKPLIDRTVARIKSWTSKFLSYAGRLQLVKSVLFGSRKAAVSWEQLCLPKSCGGWNLKDLTVWNKDAVLKNCWALAFKQDRLWGNGVDQFVQAGKFRIQKMYKFLHPVGDQVGWKRLICNSHASPKSTFIAWLAVQNRLATKDRLISWQLNIDGTCGLCQLENESLAHLFFSCPYAKDIWRQVFRDHVDPVKDVVSNIMFNVECRCQ